MMITDDEKDEKNEIETNKRKNKKYMHQQR